MTTYKRPLRKRILTMGSIFLLILCVLISLESASVLRSSLDKRNFAHLKDIVNYVEHTTDADDLRECIETLTMSEKYNELQQRLNTMVDDFHVRFIYLVIPAPERVTLYSVCSSTSDEERAVNGNWDYPLMYADEDIYTPEQLVPYVEAWDRVGEFSTYTSDSDFYGPCYTVCKPLTDSNGEVVALICVDKDLMSIHRNVNSYVFSSIGLILIIVLFFAIGMAWWLRKYITNPISELEHSTREFAKKSHDRVALDELNFNAPNLYLGDEIHSLSDSIQQMADDMKGYINGFLSAETRAATAEWEANDIAKFAYEDALTGASSKVAYDEKKATLAGLIESGGAEFAVVMIDLNDLRHINDVCGLKNGNKYIISGCDLIRDVFRNIPVYRIGVDQFAVFLEGEAYQNRDELFAILEERFMRAQEDTTRELWERVSAAAGMTEYFHAADATVEQVYRRAEMIMTRNKRIMKNQRG